MLQGIGHETECREEEAQKKLMQKAVDYDLHQLQVPPERVSHSGMVSAVSKRTARDFWLMRLQVEEGVP